MTQADYARHDRITLTGITAKGYHGIFPPQPLRMT